jgi:hypothetical protein
MASVGQFLPNSRKMQQDNNLPTLMKLCGLVAIILLLRLVVRDCWLVVVLGKNERCHGRLNAQRFSFCFLVPDAQARKHFYQFARHFLAKRSSNNNVGFGE